MTDDTKREAWVTKRRITNALNRRDVGALKEILASMSALAFVSLLHRHYPGEINISYIVELLTAPAPIGA